MSTSQRAACTSALRSCSGEMREPKWYGRPAAAEGEPAVGGALAVDDQVPAVGEGLALTEPDLIPRLVGQRLGRQHQGVDGGEHAGLALAGFACSPPWRARRTPHGRRRGRCARSRLDGLDPGALVQDGPRLDDAAGQAAHEPCRVDCGAVRGVGTAEDVGRADSALGLRLVEQGVVLRAEAPGAQLRRSRRGRSTAAAGVRAATTVPPLLHSTSQPSADATRPISSTVANISRLSRMAASRVDCRASAGRLAGNSADAQPPLRPDAPKPACSASRMTMRSDGSRCSR